jgi:hypothetical protein
LRGIMVEVTGQSAPVGGQPIGILVDLPDG